MYQVKVQERQLSIEEQDGQWQVDGHPVAWDVIAIGSRHFHVLYNQRSYRAELVQTDPTTKTLIFKINGRVYPVEVRDRFDLLLEKMGLQGAGKSKTLHAKAPMPGLIVDVRVQAGDQVRAGDPLLILEAMKMENILKATGDGEVKTVRVKKGDSVEKGQVLVEF